MHCHFLSKVRSQVRFKVPYSQCLKNRPKISHFFKPKIFEFFLRALKSPQKFWTSSSANFLGFWHISGLKSKSYYEIWTFWSKLDHQMIQFHTFLHIELRFFCANSSGFLSCFTSKLTPIFSKSTVNSYRLVFKLEAKGIPVFSFFPDWNCGLWCSLLAKQWRFYLRRELWSCSRSLSEQKEKTARQWLYDPKSCLKCRSFAKWARDNIVTNGSCQSTHW